MTDLSSIFRKRPFPPTARLRDQNPFLDSARRPSRASAWPAFVLSAWAAVWIVALWGPTPTRAQGVDADASAVPVRYAEARRAVAQVRLTAMGKVVASRSTVVAGEVAGSVESLAVRPGSRVRRGQELARLRARPLELRLAAAQGELDEAEARLRSSELRLERLRNLAGSEVVSPQNVDDAAYESQAWEGRVARLRAEVERLRDDLEHTTLRAPFDGVVVAELTQAGQWIRVGDPVVEMVALDGLEARLDIPEDRYGSLHPGDTVSVISQATGDSADGTLRAVVPKASERAHTFPAYVTLPEDSGLAIGMLVRGELVSGADRASVWVPKDALVTGRAAGQGVRQVFVVAEDFTVREVTVKPGRIDGLWQEVETISGDALEAGDFVVTHGNEKLSPGLQVRAEPQEYPVR